MNVQNYGQAATILDDGASRASFPNTGQDLLEWLGAQVDPHAWISGGGLLAALSDLLIQSITPMKEVLDWLAGDPAAVRSHASALNKAADEAAARADTLRSANRLIPVGTWTGDAANVARDTIEKLADCHEGHSTCSRLQANANVSLGGNIALTRQTVVQIVREFVVQVVQFLSAWTSAMPAGLVIIAGHVARMVSWVLSRIDELLRSLLESGSHLIGTIQHLGSTMDRAATVITTGKDPGEIHLPPVGNKAAEELGSEARASDKDYLELNQHLHHTGNDEKDEKDEYPLPKGFKELSDEELRNLGIDPSMLDNKENGFRAKIYEHKDGRIVVAFDHTHFKSVPDLIEITTGGVGVSPQTKSVMELTQALERSGRGNNVIYTGHSLGGRLATEASMMTGQPSITFNPAGVSQATVDSVAAANGESSQELMDRMNRNNRFYYSEQDPLQLLQEKNPRTEKVMPDAIGTGHGIDTHDRPYSPKAHGLESLRDNWYSE